MTKATCDEKELIEIFARKLNAILTSLTKADSRQ
jgi:hypothetical protein